MSSKYSDACKWDEGCQNCSIRNKFIVPTLTSILNSTSAKTVFDIGAATGYIARKIATNALHETQWTLVDMDEGRLQYAQEQWPTNIPCEFVCSDVFSIHKVQCRFDLVIVCNSILEMELSTQFYKQIMEFLNPTGHLIISMPDTLSDALKIVSEQGEDAIKRYADGRLSIEKIDKFTNTSYPFNAHRPITVIAGFLAEGLNLEYVKRHENNEGHFILGFSPPGLKA